MCSNPKRYFGISDCWWVPTSCVILIWDSVREFCRQWLCCVLGGKQLKFPYCRRARCCLLVAAAQLSRSNVLLNRSSISLQAKRSPGDRKPLGAICLAVRAFGLVRVCGVLHAFGDVFLLGLLVWPVNILLGFTQQWWGCLWIGRQIFGRFNCENCSSSL